MPEQGVVKQRYFSTFTNTDRWQHFVPRSGDVYVSTPPKCGTTWTTTIVTMLCKGSTDVNSAKLVHWVDADVAPVEEMVRDMAAQTGRRCIKTHTPFDGIPWYADASYIVVYRHPVDLFFSLRKHTANMKIAEPDDDLLAPVQESLLAYLDRPVDFDAYDARGFGAVIRHFRSYTEGPRPGPVLVLHYADMRADARGAIGRIAAHIGADADEALLDAIHEATSFENMRSKAEQYAPFANRDFWHDPKAFFDSGSTGKWADQLDEAAFGTYRARLAAMLTPAQIQWLETGAGG